MARAPLGWVFAAAGLAVLVACGTGGPGAVPDYENGLGQQVSTPGAGTGAAAGGFGGGTASAPAPGFGGPGGGGTEGDAGRPDGGGDASGDAVPADGATDAPADTADEAAADAPA